MPRRSVPAIVFAALVLTACSSGDPSGPGTPPPPPLPPPPSVPGPGPHFSVAVIDTAKLARILPPGSNGKILPVGHSYWYTCDFEYILQGTRPCVREKLPIRAPTSGVVWAVEHAADGQITIEGPPGLYANFSHVTPTAGLTVGDSVRAGDQIARMFTDVTFDFGVTNFGRTKHAFVRQARYGDGYLYAQNPIELYPEPLRSRLQARVNMTPTGNTLGKLNFDVAGTAQGNWFRLGTPLEESLVPIHGDSVLFLGRLLERNDQPILVAEGLDYPAGYGVVAPDPSAPIWSSITQANGLLWIKLWEIGPDGLPRFDSPQGSILLQVLAADRLKLEWFNTHDPVAAFTAGAWTYER